MTGSEEYLPHKKGSAVSDAGHTAPGDQGPSPVTRNSKSSVSRTSVTTIDRMLARTSPYDGLRVLAAVFFGVGVAAGVLIFLVGLAGLAILSVRGFPLQGVGVFVLGLMIGPFLFLGGKTVGELLRLWADIGDRTRQMAQKLEESLERRENDGP